MKRFPLIICVIAILSSGAQGGTERFSGKDTAPPPCPGWYADNEWNVSIWGAYAFTANDYPTFENSILSLGLIRIGPASGPQYDRYLESDHAWGGGIDAKYFFKRYFGFGIEGFGVVAQRSTARVNILLPPPGFAGSVIEIDRRKDARTIGALLGTFTLRYPIGCSRFSPYVWGGGGVIFGGGEIEKIAINDIPSGAFLTGFKRGTEARPIVQFGGGLEVRLTRHIGLMNDFSWNIIDGRNNNFEMARTGINFAF